MAGGSDELTMMMMDWSAAYRPYDDDTLTALANVGLLRRAAKDVEAGKVCWATTGDAPDNTLEADGQVLCWTHVARSTPNAIARRLECASIFWRRCCGCAMRRRKHTHKHKHSRQRRLAVR